MQTMTHEQWNQLRAKARRGDAEAQFEVGACHEEGLFDPVGRVLARRDLRAAVRWYLKSAIAGNPFAQNNLGVCLSDGRGAPRDEAEALRWLKRAVRQGHWGSAASNVACVYRDLGNHRRAFLWYQRAVGMGDGGALVEVGRRYYTGVGVRRDPRRAVDFFRRAIVSRSITQADREDAMFLLGRAFYEGRGVMKSNRRALKWLSKANRDDDHPEARELIEIITKEIVS